jgi:hypothetical protein
MAPDVNRGVTAVGARSERGGKNPGGSSQPFEFMKTARAAAEHVRDPMLAFPAGQRLRLPCERNPKSPSARSNCLVFRGLPFGIAR